MRKPLTISRSLSCASPARVEYMTVSIPQQYCSRVLVFPVHIISTIFALHVHLFRNPPIQREMESDSVVSDLRLHLLWTVLTRVTHFAKGSNPPSYKFSTLY